MIHDDGARKRYMSCVDGLPPAAQAIIERVQPYHRGDGAHIDPLGLISRIDNADKHQNLLVLGSGGADVLVTGSAGGVRLNPYIPTEQGVLVEDGAIVAKFDWNPEVRGYLWESEVHMEIKTTPTIIFKAPQIAGGKMVYEPYTASTGMLRMIDGTRKVLRALSPFVLR